MNEQLIFNILENGSDNDGIGSLISYFLLATLFGCAVFFCRDRVKKGMLLENRAEAKSGIQVLFANNAFLIVIVLCLIGIGLIYFVWNQYRSDKELIVSGNFHSISGTLDEYLVTELRQNNGSRYARIMDVQPNVQERDKIVVNSRIFFVHCERAWEVAPDSIGVEGTCLGLHHGQNLRIDYTQIDPTHYRSEPLRIWITQ